MILSEHHAKSATLAQRIYNPCCGSGGMFVQSEKFVEAHAATFRRDKHPDLKADFVIANPPFNDSDWFRKEDDVRWQYGIPPKGNANFAWVQHFVHHLAPKGKAGFVLANGSMSSPVTADQPAMY